MNDEVEVLFRCTHCGVTARYRGEYRPSLHVTCGGCRKDVTSEFKRAFFRGVAADISASIVERENRPFLQALDTRWPGPEAPGEGTEDERN